MIQLSNVQAIVARSSDRPFVTVPLFKIEAADGAKAFLRQWLSMTPSGISQPAGDVPTLHFLFSWNGIEKLLRPHPVLKVEEGRKAFETFFTDPDQAPDRPAVATDLGFTAESAPQHWWDGRFSTADVDLALHCSFASSARQTEGLELIRASARTLGLRELELDTFPQRALSGGLPQGGILHFGYRDGITTPQIDWEDASPAGSVNLRQFVLGYPTQDYPTSPRKPGPWQDFARDGSFAGLTWLHQNVAAFNAFLRDNAPLAAATGITDEPEEWLAAKLMGRWRDGSPLAKHPTTRPSAPDFDDHFGYADDPNGEKCPLTAHIRIVNLRDQPMSFPNQSRFPGGPPRLLRRGFAYGPKLEGTVDDGRARGLVGLFLCARVNEQFYTVLRWMQATEFSDLFDGIPNGARSQDSVIGNRGKPGANPQALVRLPGGGHLALGLRDFIKYRGVALFFAPSMKALAILSGE